MHRRKTSKEDVATTSTSPPSTSPTAVHFAPEVDEKTTKPRVKSQPSTPSQSSPVRVSFLPQSRSMPVAIPIPSSPLRPGFDNTRLSPEKYTTLAAQNHSRAHSRIHSRNLSVFFPRPGQSEAPIAEDGGQEIEAPVSLMPPASTPPPRRLRDGFQFGTRPPGVLSESPEDSLSSGPSPPPATRRGHHHKHSMSHNFFSFMDPGSTHVPGTPATASFSPQTPATPWQPISPFPASTSMPTFPSSDLNALLPSSSSGQLASGSAAVPLHAHSFFGKLWLLPSSLKQALLFAILQFSVGATLWVTGQQKASLASTGLGYWVVFDAAGVYLRVMGSMARFGDQRSLRNPYGTLRVETVALFAQSIYLIFAAVYVCKETVEHVILSTGDSHHHHHGDEDELVGLVFPDLLILLSLSLIAFSNFIYNNHSKLVDAIGYRFPTLYTLIKPADASVDMLHASPVARFLANPFTLAPIAFSLCLLFTSFLLEPEHHRAADLLLAAVETVFTFAIAYPAAVSLGKVLLQTAPERGQPSGQMESFSRALKEVAHHHSVLHVPAPHVWQLTPTPSDPTEKGAVVATVEVHVKKGVGDDEVLELTRWAWTICTGALGGEVTVGILRE